MLRSIGKQSGKSLKKKRKGCGGKDFIVDNEGFKRGMKEWRRDE